MNDTAAKKTYSLTITVDKKGFAAVALPEEDAILHIGNVEIPIPGNETLRAMEAQTYTWQVNSITQLFENLSLEQALHLIKLAENIVSKGRTPDLDDPAITAFFKVVHVESSMGLFAVATIFPQKALLSALRFFNLSC